MIHDKMEELH